VERLKTADEELTKRQERALRILDAAAELIQRWGYKKVAVDDIARLAGVAKGTIYLHWKTREDLFMALLLRESVETVKAMLERIDGDPEGLYLRNITRHALYVTMTRPLTKALFIQDVAVFGELLQSGRADVSALAQQKLLASRQLLTLFRKHGMIRTDQTLAAQIKIYSAITIGFMTIDQYLPAEFHSSPEESTALLAATVHNALERDEPVAPEVLQELKETWDRVVGQFMQMIDERLHKELA
jgi:AcrR family transcriptional regulator